MPEIEISACNLCGLCVNVCDCTAIIIANGTIRINETPACDWCTLCEAVCPTGALTCAFDVVIVG